ncbi:unnamed protein product [Adineta ricciae]|uniref:Uncharacterized protein n=2 Tax=Adineta ricciae TaxID=249248 RepID=A0A814R785_ADIRI|nr:unnamed protein product [Adineta ricciae]
MGSQSKTSDIKSYSITGMAGSYNENSSPQLLAVQHAIPLMRKAIDAWESIPSSFPTIIADFGSSHGANTTFIIKTMLDYIKQSKSQLVDQSFLIIYNDLPSNDWAAVFNIVNEESQYYGLGNGRSFYSQCLPSNSLSIGFSSTSLQWLSRKPCNISNHCIFLFAQASERAAFRMQAKEDLEQFIKTRSHELISGGVLIVTAVCSNKKGESILNHACDCLYQCSKLLPLSEQELLDYTIPIYFREYEDCIDENLFKRYSFQLVSSYFYLVDVEFDRHFEVGEIKLEEFVQLHTGFMRSWSEPALRKALQNNGKRTEEEINELLIQFWALYKDQVRKSPREFKSSFNEACFVLKKC